MRGAASRERRTTLRGERSPRGQSFLRKRIPASRLRDGWRPFAGAPSRRSLGLRRRSRGNLHPRSEPERIGPSRERAKVRPYAQVTGDARVLPRRALAPDFRGFLRSERAARAAVVHLNVRRLRLDARSGSSTTPWPRRRPGRAQSRTRRRGHGSVIRSREAPASPEKATTSTPKGEDATRGSNASRDLPARLTSCRALAANPQASAVQPRTIARRLQISDRIPSPSPFPLPLARERGAPPQGDEDGGIGGIRSDGSGPGPPPPHAVHAARGVRARRRSRTRKRAGQPRRDHRGPATLGARGEHPREVERGSLVRRREPYATGSGIRDRTPIRECGRAEAAPSS